MDKKPLGRKAYGRIPHLSNSRTGPSDKMCEAGHERIATKTPRDVHDLVIIEEKLDGSCCSITKVEGTIIPLTRAGYRAETSPYEMHHFFAKWTMKRQGMFDKLLEEGERVVGEWMLEAHGTRYKLEHEPFVAFDLMTGIKRLNYLAFLERVVVAGLVHPRVIHIGQPISVKKVLSMLEPSGHGAIDPIEGAVWRVERKGVVDFLCKYVRPGKEDGIFLSSISGNPPVYNYDLNKI